MPLRIAAVTMAWRQRSQTDAFHPRNPWTSREILNNALGEEQICFPDALFSYIRVLRLHQPGARLKGFRASVWMLRLFINVTEPEPRDRWLREITFNRVVRALGHCFGCAVWKSYYLVMMKSPFGIFYRCFLLPKISKLAYTARPWM